MLSVKSLKMMMTTRSLSTRVRREVMISQSRDLLSNTALEDWAVKNINQKLQLRLIDAQVLAVNHAQQIGYLLNWINRR